MNTTTLTKLQLPFSTIVMSDEERKQLQINYHFTDTEWGEIVLASSPQGICALFFADDRHSALQDLQQLFKNVIFKEVQDGFHKQAICILNDVCIENCLPLHLWGTKFQHRVWQALLNIPHGDTVTYRQFATNIGHPKSCRAVGNAIGKNPVSLFIPCHRVIQTSGKTGNYRWGKERKYQILLSEGYASQSKLELYKNS